MCRPPPVRRCRGPRRTPATVVGTFLTPAAQDTMRAPPSLWLRVSSGRLDGVGRPGPTPAHLDDYARDPAGPRPISHSQRCASSTIDIMRGEVHPIPRSPSALRPKLGEPAQVDACPRIVTSTSSTALQRPATRDPPGRACRRPPRRRRPTRRTPRTRPSPSSSRRRTPRARSPAIALPSSARSPPVAPKRSVLIRAGSWPSATSASATRLDEPGRPADVDERALGRRPARPPRAARGRRGPA